MYTIIIFSVISLIVTNSLNMSREIQNYNHELSSLTPSQVVGKKEYSPEKKDNHFLNINMVNDGNKKKSKLKKKNEPLNVENNKKRTQQTKVRASKGSFDERRDAKSGNIPYIKWRSIPMEHLRSHPSFVALPTPDSISDLRSIKDVKLFRQDSLEWDALHEGRCTTSIVASALGFLEPNASKFLNVPRSWVTINKNSNKSSGGKKAYDRLIHHNSALKNVDEINRLLRRGKKTNSTESQSFRIWTRKKKYPFVAKYLPKVTKASQHKRKRIL